MRYYRSCYFLYLLSFSDGKRYIGYTANPLNRVVTHRYRFKRESLMSILCIGSRDYIIALEPKAIIAFHTNDPAFGYNELIGHRLPPVTRMKISNARKTQKIAAWNKGIPRSPDERAAIKAGLDKSEKTSGARQKLVELNKSRRGIPLSAETRAKQSTALKGRQKTPEWRAKISQSMRGNHNRSRN